MTLEEEIAEAQSYFDDPPSNESNTCERVILPLLWTGYPRRDIESRKADSAGQYPDYTLLPNTSSTWFIEAKAWRVTLEDTHSQQALNYANQNGKRFVVLTNGQEWRLYDNTVQGVAQDKLVAKVYLRDTDRFTVLMNALSKTEVLSNGIERYLQQEREREERERRQARQAELLGLLEGILPTQLCDGKSEPIKALTLCLKRRDALHDLDAETVASWFREGRHAPSQVEAEPVSPSPTTAITCSLEELKNNSKLATGRKPSILRFPNGEEVSLRTWRDFAEQMVRYLFRQGLPVPVPFDGGYPVTRWFLNSEPKNKFEDSSDPFREINVGDRLLYLNTGHSASAFLTYICQLCIVVGVATEGFYITFQVSGE